MPADSRSERRREAARDRRARRRERRASEGPRRGVAAATLETWQILNPEQRAAGIGALLLIISTFGPFSFVEVGLVLTGAGILVLLKKRADRAIFHLPFGDGAVIAAAGGWSGLLILARLFDRPLGQGLLALVCSAIIVLAGLRERARRPMDDLPSDAPDGEARRGSGAGRSGGRAREGAAARPGSPAGGGSGPGARGSGAASARPASAAGGSSGDRAREDEAAGGAGGRGHPSEPETEPLPGVSPPPEGPGATVESDRLLPP